MNFLYIFLYLSAKNGYTDLENISDRRQLCFVYGEKCGKSNHLIKDIVIDDDSEDTRTHKIFRALQEICYEFDLENPIWLDNNIADFKRHSRTRFNQDSFIEHISFDYLEIQVIEED